MSELNLGALIELLRTGQNPDGGWGAARGLASNTEATSLALLALAARPDPSGQAALAGGIGWLEARQRPDGAWPLSSGVEEGSWATSLAVLALAELDADGERVRRGGRWLLAERGRRLGWLRRLLFALLPEERGVRLDPGLVGWPWRSGSFSWVEPTACALLALKRLRGVLGAQAVEARIGAGERLLYDRMCAGGGWNYGNSRVLGEALEPYPEVTAVVLIALQDRAAEPATEQSLHALERMLGAAASSLSLGWSMLCFALYERKLEPWRELLAERYAATGFLGETRTVAVAALALADATDWLRV